MKLFKRKKGETLFTVEGNANDLLQVSNNDEIKQTRLFYLLAKTDEEDSETLDVCITSSNPYKNFPIFDKLLDKKFRVTVEIIDE